MVLAVDANNSQALAGLAIWQDFQIWRASEETISRRYSHLPVELSLSIETASSRVWRKARILGLSTMSTFAAASPRPGMLVKMSKLAKARVRVAAPKGWTR
jgi:hypothetical protein